MMVATIEVATIEAVTTVVMGGSNGGGGCGGGCGGGRGGGKKGLKGHRGGSSSNE